MSAIPLEDAIERASSPERANKLPPKAFAYFLLVGAAALAVTVPFLAELDRHTGDWLEFALLATSVAVAQFFVVRTPGNKSYHTTGVFLIAAALLVQPALLALIPLIQHIPEWLRSRGTWYVQMTNIFVFTIATMSAWGAAHVVLGADGLDRLRRRPLRTRRHGSVGRPRRAQLRADRTHDPPGQRSSDAPDVLVPDPLDGVRLRSPRRRPRRLLDRQPLARSVRDRAAAADPPCALGAAAAGGGARRPEDGPLQRALLRLGALGGARTGGALRTAAVADHGRPRPAARDQQHLRPPRRRRGAEGHRRGLPRRAAPLRRPGPLRRRGVLDPPAGDTAGAGDGDRRADPACGRREALRRRDVERADPCHRLDRRRRLSEGRTGSERAHPSGRPRRLPGEAAGAQPRPRRELGAAPDAGRPHPAARRGAGGGRPPRAARTRPRGAAGAGAAAHGAHDERAALPPALGSPRPARRPRQHARRRVRASSAPSSERRPT